MSQISPPCAICRGSKEEHFDSEGKPKTQHVYTETPGELRSTQQEEREKMRARGPQMVALPPQLPGRGDEVTTRLVNLLVDKGLISPSEAYSVVTGHTPASAGFRDPAH